MKILMAVDGSRESVAAMTAAARMFSPDEHGVDMICVAPRASGHAAGMRQERLNRRARRILESVQAVLAAEGVAAATQVRTGSPGRVLIRESAHYDVTVVSAASHRNGPAAGLGPVASRLAEHSRGAVLIVRPRRTETGVRILAAADGSEGSLEAIAMMADLIDLSEVEVTLLHVVETPWLHEGPDQEWLGYQEEKEVRIDQQANIAAELVREGEGIVARARQELPARVGVRTMVQEGIPADEILSEAERGEYDLIVIGASGVSDLKHQILGSVSSKIAWSAPCSVLLAGVRAGVESPRVESGE